MLSDFFYLDDIEIPRAHSGENLGYWYHFLFNNNVLCFLIENIIWEY